MTTGASVRSAAAGDVVVTLEAALEEGWLEADAGVAAGGCAVQEPKTSADSTRPNQAVFRFSRIVPPRGPAPAAPTSVAVPRIRGVEAQPSSGGGPPRALFDAR